MAAPAARSVSRLRMPNSGAIDPQPGLSAPAEAAPCSSARSKALRLGVSTNTQGVPWRLQWALIPASRRRG